MGTFLENTIKEVAFILNELAKLRRHFDDNYIERPHLQVSLINFFTPPKDLNENQSCLEMAKACIFKLAAVLERVNLMTRG